jgi:hypothetical protein
MKASVLLRALPLGALAVLAARAAGPAPADPRIAADGAFPDPAGAKRICGEVTLVEHVNRMGILRPDRDGSLNKYFWDLPHQFQLLPYAAIRLQGAPAAFEDVPLGTHLHGVFYLGPEGDFEVNPPPTEFDAGRAAKPDMRSVESRYSRALRLEDDFSYFSRLGHGWKVAAIGAKQDSLSVQRVRLEDESPVDEKQAGDGVKSQQVLRLDRGCTVWKGRSLGTIDDLTAGQTVQVNITWATLLGSHQQDGICREIWTDPESRQAAAERRRQAHLAAAKRRGVPALVLKTTHSPGEGAKGRIELALADAADAELLETFGPKAAVGLKPVEASLRGYRNGFIPLAGVEVRRVPNPPPGHSGFELTALCQEMREGFRAGRTVLVGRTDWDNLTVSALGGGRPQEEELSPRDNRIFHVAPKTANRDPQPTITPKPTPDAP